jgi:hypothetical protein
VYKFRVKSHTKRGRVYIRPIRGTHPRVSGLVRPNKGPWLASTASNGHQEGRMPQEGGNNAPSTAFTRKESGIVEELK